MVLNIIDRFYDSQPELKRLLLRHSDAVRRKCLQCAENHAADFTIDREFVSEAAMLHDIGIIHCDAPDILCHGTKPYICHGIIGAEMLRDLGMEKHARVCERHTGAGLTIEDIRRQHLPLPERDFCPQTLEEQLVCYADKFFSKSGDPDSEKNLGRVMRSMERHGEDTLRRFLHLHSLFG